MALVVKNLLANGGNQEMWVPSLACEDPLEEGMATHSSILAWRRPWAEEPGWEVLGRGWGGGKATVHRVTKSWA